MGDQVRLVSLDQVVRFLKDHIGRHVGCLYSSHLELVEKVTNSQPNDSQHIKNFLHWCENRKYVKLVKSKIPSQILPEATLIDIKIRTRGPDDRVFDRNEDIRSKIARGNSILVYEENGMEEAKILIYGLKKFTGGLGDEDEFDRKAGEWRKYFLKDIKYSQYVISLQKANGETAHLSCSWINDGFLLCTGSKNVHILFKNKSDLALYQDDRHKHSVMISKTIVNFLETMTAEIRSIFLSFLCWSNLTVIFEILLPYLQHIEDISAYKEPFLQFIAFTENKIVEKPHSLCVMPPDCAIEFGKIFGLVGVKYEKVFINQIDAHISKVRLDHAYEGVVLYFIDSDLNIIGMLKKKTTWYIILRALREKVKVYLSPKSSWNVADLKEAITKRLYDIRSWIGFSSEDLDKWENLCHKFCEWFCNSFQSNPKIKRDFQERYPVVWNNFLSKCNLSDRIKLHIEKTSHTRLGDQEPDNEI